MPKKTKEINETIEHIKDLLSPKKDKKESKDIGWNLDNSYLNLPKVFFSKINLNPVSSPQLIILNDTLAKELGLDSNYLKGEEGVKILSGSETDERGL